MGFNETTLGTYEGQQANPAAPDGLRQTSERMQGGGFGNTFDSIYDEQGYAGLSSAWYTGQNTEGTNNGWSTDFYAKMFEQNKQLMESGQLATQFDRNDATGIVSWDHQSAADEKKTYTFGDVYEDGYFKGNVYTLFDQATADSMMMDITMQRDQKQDIMSDSDPMARLQREVASLRETRRTEIPKGFAAAEFEKRVTEKAGDFDDQGIVDKVAAVGSGLLTGASVALGTAATAAAAGTAVGPVGTAVGAIGGFVAGAAGAYLNQDEVNLAAARAWERTALSREEQNPLATVGVGLAEWAGFTQSALMQPLQNLSKGVQDVAGESVRGDEVIDYYATTDTGRTTRPAWMKPLTMAAAVGDGFLNFASPVARAAYFGSMGTLVTGQVGALVASGGETFNDRSGSFENIFLDEKGQFDPVSGAAGIMNIGIDAIQMVGWRGLVRQSDETAEALANGGRVTQMAGSRYTLDASGNVVGRQRDWMTLMAPSEQVSAWSVARTARVAALKRGDVVTADDFYRAAAGMNNGTRKLKQALMNGFGEGYEEAIQSVLEPISHDGKLSAGAVVDSFLMGAAAGTGMSFAATAGAPTAAKQLESQAYWLETMRRGGVEPVAAEWDAQWKSATDQQKRVWATRSPAEIEATNEAVEGLRKQYTSSMIASESDVAWAMQAKRTMFEKALARAGGQQDRYHVISGLLSGDQQWRAEAVATSAVTALTMVNDRWEQLQFVIDSDTAALPTLAPELQAEGTERIRLYQLMRAAGDQLLNDLTQLVEQISDETLPEDQRQGLVRTFNRTLEQAFDGQRAYEPIQEIEATEQDLARAGALFATMMHSREPKLDAGAYVGMLPQADWDLTVTESDNVMLVNTDILTAIAGDFDGDKMHSEFKLSISLERMIQARSGAFLLGAGDQVDIGSLTDVFDNELTRFFGMHLQGGSDQISLEAEAKFKKIMAQLKKRYGKTMSKASWVALQDDYRAALVGGTANARVTMLNGLARSGSEKIDAMGRESLTNEWLTASKIMRDGYREFQANYRRMRDAQAPSATIEISAVDTPKGTNARKKRATTDVETLGIFGTGNSMFRKFQQIHITKRNAAVDSAGVDTEQSDLRYLVDMYRELARFATTSEYTRITGVDSIGATVLLMLERFVDSAMADPEMKTFSPTTAMSVLANVKAKDVYMENGQFVSGPSDMSFLQVLLKHALQADKEKHRLTWDKDEKLRSRHAALVGLTLPNTDASPVNAERAFIEIFKMLPFEQSLGSVTGNLAPGTTPEQWINDYMKLPPEMQTQREQEFTNVDEYLDRVAKTNIPYSFNEMERKEISPFRSMMDAMLAVARSELTFEPKTTMKNARRHVGGRRADVTHRAQDDFLEQHQTIFETMLKIRGQKNLEPGKRTLTPELVQEMFQRNAGLAAAIRSAIPPEAVSSMFLDSDGQLKIDPWLFDVFATRDSEEALFKFWRGITLTQWQASLVDMKEDDSDFPRKRGRLKTRFLRLMYDLNEEPGQLQMEQLIKKLYEFKNLDQFFLWLNTTPGFRGQQAPFLPFYDNVEDFEGDTGGGLTTSNVSGDIRLAIADAKRQAATFAQVTDFRIERRASTKVLVDSIKRARDGKGNKVDERNRTAFLKALDIARTLPRATAPSMMFAMTSSALNGVTAFAHDKGKTIEYAKAFGEFQSLMDAFGFLPGMERVMEVLTAHSLDSLNTNLGDASRFGGTAMDSDGTVIAWSPLEEDKALEMLDDPESEDLAFSLMTPAALDLSMDRLVERSMIEPTLKDLLDNRHYERLFNLDGPDALQNAMLYGSMVDARARAEGGHFSFTRYVNDLAIRRLTAEDRAQGDNPARLAKITEQAYLDAARALQQVGLVLASENSENPDLLQQLRRESVQKLRDHARKTRISDLLDGDEILEQWVEDMKLDVRRKANEAIKELDDTDPSFVGQAAALAKGVNATLQKLDLLLEDDLLGAAVSRFEMTGDPEMDRAAKARTVEYVLSQSDFSQTAPESARLWAQVQSMGENGEYPGDDFDWDQLSRSAMGVYLNNQVTIVASHVSLPDLPKGDPAISLSRYYKYHDPGAAYIATDLLTPGPLTAAALWLHRTANQPLGAAISLTTPAQVLDRTVLAVDKLGDYTPVTMSHTVEVQQRMDSAAGGPSVAQPGNGPKRHAGIAAASRPRWDLVPEMALASTVKTTADMFDGDPWTVLGVTPAGMTEEQDLPLAQLDNRFYSAIRINDEVIDLSKMNIGFRQNEDSLYRYVSLDRLKDEVRDYARRKGLDPALVSVELDFFHPDSRPAGKEWMHNAYFDGRSHTLGPDRSESLISALWADNGGMIASLTQRLLDASKKGKLALPPFQQLDPIALAEANAHWDVGQDLGAMLRAKTQLMMQWDTEIPQNFYNAIYKQLSLSHLLVGRVDGKPATMTMEEAIAHKATGEAWPMDDVRLVALSPDVLRSIVGDTGDQVAAGYTADELSFNPDTVLTYEGPSPLMVNRFGAGWLSDGTLGTSSLRYVAHARKAKLRRVQVAGSRGATRARVVYLNNRASEIWNQRSKVLTSQKFQLGYGNILAEAQASVGAEVGHLQHLSVVGIMPRNPEEAKHTGRLLARLQADGSGLERGWQFLDKGSARYSEGVYTVDSLSNTVALEDQMAKGDMVLLRLDSFDRPEMDLEQQMKRVDKALDYLVERGVRVVLGSGNGGTELRYYAEQYLEDQRYQSMASSRHIYEMIEDVEQSQNQRSYESTLFETNRFRPFDNHVIFLANDPIGTTENMAMLNPLSTRLASSRLMENLLPTNRFGNYNLITDDNNDRGVYLRTLTHLKSVTDPTNRPARETLLAQAGNDLKGDILSMEEALNRFHQKMMTNDSLVLGNGQELKVGDIVPFVHVDGRVILYRHGLKTPAKDDLPALFKQNDRMNVAVARSEVDEDMTANSGIIREISPRYNFGRRLVLEAPLQQYGAKFQLELAAMKYLTVPMPQEWQKYMSTPIFDNGLRPDLLSDRESADAKEARYQRIVGYRNALAFFQFDFTDDLVKFFFPDQDPKDPTARNLTVTMLESLQNNRALKIPTAEVAQLQTAVSEIAVALTDFETENSDVAPGWTSRLEDTDPSSLIAAAIVTYLMTPGARLDNVISSSGFSHPQALGDVVTTRRVPGLFAGLLNKGVGSELHTELINRFNDQLYRAPDGSGMSLAQNWEVTSTAADGSTLIGYLQYGEIHSASDNPFINGQAYDPNKASSISVHNSLAANMQIGARTATDRLGRAAAYAKSFQVGGTQPKLGQDISFWEMMTAMPDRKQRVNTGFRRETPAETARRAISREERIGFFHPYDADAMKEWTPAQRSDFDKIAGETLAYMNMGGNQRAMFDVWVRQYLGRPYGLDENGNDLSLVPGERAVQAATEIARNVRKGLLPTATGAVPLMDLGHLTAIYTRNKDRDGAWAPRMYRAENSAKARSWDDWVNTAFGTSWLMKDGQEGPTPEPEFHRMFLLAMDGFMHTYQDATADTRYLPVSSDILVARNLADPETNRMLISISADENLLATDPVLFNTSRAGLEEMITGRRIYADGRLGPDNESALGWGVLRRARWNREAKAPVQRNKKMRGITSGGETFISQTTTTSWLMRSAIHLRVGNSLFNPQLALSAPFEAWWRRGIDNFANTLTGESTGWLGLKQSQMAQMLADGKMGPIAEQLGWKVAHTPEEIMQIRQLAAAIATNPEFRAMIFKELSFLQPDIPGINVVERTLAKYSKAGALLQDPTWGILPTSLATMYAQAILRKVANDGYGENVYSAKMAMTRLAQDPSWLKDKDPEAHAMAIASIGQIRSLKPTVLSLMWRGLYEPLADSSKPWRNTAGQMVKMLTIFHNFWANSLVTMTGMQGVADWTAFALDGKTKPKIIGRMQAAVKGEPFDSTIEEQYDMTEVIEGMDLVDSFIRGGVTHTALFALGMWAGGTLGLSGEDDEEKRRRRASEAQGAGMIYDPRELQNAVENVDAIFLDWLPFGLDARFRIDPNDESSRAMGQMSWTLRYFLSPIIGFERFYNSGDFGDVIAGFKDALGGHPLVSSQLWNEAVQTAAQLHAEAVDHVEAGDEVQAGHLMVTAVGTLERMLFENSFINMIYQGMDAYDRDPYAEPARDSDQIVQGDIRGNAYETSGLQPYSTEDGEARQAYVTRDPFGAQLRTFSETRFGVAFIGSLASFVTGNGYDSDFWRSNMVIKTRSVQLMPDSPEDLQQNILAAWRGANVNADSKSLTLTEDEAIQIIKRRYEAAGIYWNQDEVEREASQMIQRQGMAAASMVDAATGRESLTDEGRRAVIMGLYNGSVDLASASLNGVFMTREDRDKMRDILTVELVQEGVDLGLSKEGATWRMRRIMFGTNQPEGTPTLSSLIYTDQIPWSDKQEYNQLNTTYMIGLDGRPIATGFNRDGLLGAFGLKPIKSLRAPIDGLTQDARGNSVDNVVGINTGMRALEKRPDDWEIPTIEEITREGLEAVERAIQDIDIPTPAYAKKGTGSGWRNFGGGGGGGGYSSGGGGYFQRMYALPRGTAPYGNDVPFINVSNPFIRRANIRRERIWSERGRLKQWQ